MKVIAISNIIRLKSKQDNLVKNIEDILEKAKRGEFISFMFAGKCEDGDIATSWSNADVGRRNELISHMQVDLMMAVVEANADKLF